MNDKLSKNIQKIEIEEGFHHEVMPLDQQLEQQ